MLKLWKSLINTEKKIRIWEKNNRVKQVKQVKQFHRETAKQWNSCSEKKGETVKQRNSDFRQNFALCSQMATDNNKLRVTAAFLFYIFDY